MAGALPTGVVQFGSYDWLVDIADHILKYNTRRVIDDHTSVTYFHILNAFMHAGAPCALSSVTSDGGAWGPLGVVCSRLHVLSRAPPPSSTFLLCRDQGEALW